MAETQISGAIAGAFADIIRLLLLTGARKVSAGVRSFDLAIDSKLRACDLTLLKICDIAAGGEVKRRAILVQKKTGRPVQFWDRQARSNPATGAAAAAKA